MRTCFACEKDAEGYVLVPKFPKGSVAFCTKPACQRAAQRRAALVFRNNPKGAQPDARPVS